MNLQIWSEILKEAERLGLPIKNKRGVLREFLQTKILAYLYEQKGTEKLQFMGGTALRIVYGSSRFSEDLDFDNFGLIGSRLRKRVERVSLKLEKEGIENILVWKKTGQRAVIAFRDILYKLRISGHKAEKLKINFDHQPKRGKVFYQVFFLSKFDVNQRIVVNTPEVILAEKIVALLSRGRVIPRDIFDISWLLSKNYLPEKAVLSKFGLRQDRGLVKRLINRSEQVKKSQLDRELLPFLFDQDSLKLLRHFPDLLEKLVS